MAGKLPEAMEPNLPNLEVISFRIPWLYLRTSKLDVSEDSGIPKWMVYRENPIKLDDLGVPLFLETPKLEKYGLPNFQLS